MSYCEFDTKIKLAELSADPTLKKGLIWLRGDTNELWASHDGSAKVRLAPIDDSVLLRDGSRPLTGNLNFAQHQALNLVYHKAASAPSSPVEGQVYYNTSDKKLYYYDGTSWVKATGITKLSELSIDTDKDWGGYGIYNLGYLDVASGGHVKAANGYMEADRDAGSDAVVAKTYSPADSTNTLRDSPNIKLTGAYWDGSASVDVSVWLYVDVVNTTPEFWLKIDADTGIRGIAPGATGMALGSRDALWDAVYAELVEGYASPETEAMRVKTSLNADSTNTMRNSPRIAWWGAYWNGSASRDIEAYFYLDVIDTTPVARLVFAGDAGVAGIVPGADATYDLGALGLRWANIYAQYVRTGDLIFKNNFRITEDGDGLVLLNDKGEPVLRIDRNGNLRVFGSLRTD